MAGLLDDRAGKLTPWQRFIRPAAASREDVNEGYYANQMGLLGSEYTNVPNAEGTVSYGLMDGQQTQPQYNTQGPGTGYLGGQMPLGEYNMRSDANAARYYGEGPVKQMQANRAAMNRQMQEQMYDASNMSAYQRGQLGATQNQNNQVNLFKEMGYARQNEELYRNTTEMAGNILGSMSDNEGMIDYANTNGVQHNQLVVTLAKSILGNEAVNVDDRGAITLAGGAPGWLGSVVAKANGGSLGESDFYNVVDQLQNNISTGMQRNQAMRDKSLGRMKTYGGNESHLPVQINPVQRYRLAGQGSSMADGIFSGSPDQPARVGNASTFKGKIPNLFGD